QNLQAKFEHRSLAGLGWGSFAGRGSFRRRFGWGAFLGCYRKLERGLLNRLADHAPLQAARTNAGVARGAVGRRDLYTLQIGLELPAADARNFRADATQILRLAAVLYLVAHTRLFVTVLTMRHVSDPYAVTT